MKTAISIPEDVFQSAETLAKQLGISRSELYVAALKTYLRRREQLDVTEQLDAVYAREDSSLEPVLAAMQFGSLTHDEW